MLEYENQLLLDSVEDSCLFVFAKGLSIERVLVNLIKVYGTNAHLIFVLSANAGEEAYFKERVSGSTLDGEPPRVMSITTEVNPNERKELYAHGGVFFITSRIMVVDFLKEVVPAEKITGMIILRAHNVIESSQEAFILRLYRTKNKTGFIKAFSQSPTSFLIGFSRVSSVMRSCFLANLSLWPRFHAAVKESLKPRKGTDGEIEGAQSSVTADDDVIEIQLKLTEYMREIQSNLLDLVTWSVSELKRLVPALNDEEITPETALTKGFEKLIQAHIDPVWNTISAKAKEMLNDLKIFRLLLTQLTKSDCVSFYSTLCNYTSAEAAFKSSWVVSNSAEKIIVAAKARLKRPQGKQDKVSDEEQLKSSSTEFKPEVHPKWLALSEILAEIAVKAEKDAEDPDCDINTSQVKTIVFAEDVRTCSILREYLSHGSEVTLGKLIRNADNIKLELPPELISKLNSIHYNQKAMKDKEVAARAEDAEVQVTLTQIERKYLDVEFLQAPVFIRPLQTFGDTEAFGIAETLDALRPDAIIIFDPDLELIRQIEVHKARIGPSQKVSVYFLVFRNSVEEQIYLTAIQREKYAFEKLIEEKAAMVIPNEREGKDELNQDLWRDPRKANQTVSTSGQSRRNMQAPGSEREIILVDMREFRSELPSLIHKRGIDLEPLTLDVGDYILTPEICVERKSISDLIGSLNSGRLYKQAEAMGRHYQKPVLLIEHEQSSVSGRYRNDLTQVMPKLQLLTMNFPKLRIIWSPGAHYTSEVFHELKRDKPQPDPVEAMSIVKEGTGAHTISKYNPISHGLLSKLPGVDCRNVYTILNRVENLGSLCELNEEGLTSILENSGAAKVLYSGLHTNLSKQSIDNPEVAGTTGSGSSTGNSLRSKCGGGVTGGRSRPTARKR